MEGYPISLGIYSTRGGTMLWPFGKLTDISQRNGMTFHRYSVLVCAKAVVLLYCEWLNFDCSKMENIYISTESLQKWQMRYCKPIVNFSTALQLLTVKECEVKCMYCSQTFENCFTIEMLYTNCNIQWCIILKMSEFWIENTDCPLFDSCY